MVARRQETILPHQLMQRANQAVASMVAN